MLSPEELPGYRVVALHRVSNISKKSESSLNRQDKNTVREFNRLEDHYDAVIVKTYRNKQSASSMDRESLNEILKMAKNDEFDILMVWAIHRLTRASLPETMEYILELKNEGIILYSDRDGYFDWDDPDDFSLLMDRIKNAREWRNEIFEGAVSACKDILSDGHWPYGPLGYGLIDKERDGISIIDGYEPIIKEIFNTYTSCEDEKITSELVAKDIKNEHINPPSKYQVEKVLENELYIGNLIVRQTNEFVREKEDINIIPQNLFDNVQEMRSRPAETKDTTPEPQKFPSEIYGLICRYGQEYAVENVSAIRWCCPKCESTDINVSDTTVEKLGINIPRIYCCAEYCEYQGAAIRLRELHKIDLSLPLVCPECQRTEGFEVKKVLKQEVSEEMFEYTCEYCGGSMIKSGDPSPNIRGLQSTSAIKLNNSKKHTPEKQTDIDTKNNSNQSKKEIINMYEVYLKKNGPGNAKTCEIMLTAAKLLIKEGPLSTSELKNKLSEKYGGEYSSKESLWQATFYRFYDDLLGYSKTSYGQYDFEDEELTTFIECV